MAIMKRYVVSNRKLIRKNYRFKYYLKFLLLKRSNFNLKFSEIHYLEFTV